MIHFLKDHHIWLMSVVLLGAAIVAGRVAHAILFSAGRRFAKRTGSLIDNSIVRHGDKPAKLIFPLFAVFLVLPATSLPPHLMAALRHILALGVLASVAWLLIALIDVFEDVVAGEFRVDVRDNLRARKIQTQAQVLRRTAVVVIIIATLAVMLMTFPSIRQFGLSLLASAGLAGLVAGMAARPMLSSLLAGIQIALTEPIRLEDVVIVEGEWGWIEEITTTYVVVRIWDLRRLVVPLSYFIEHPFQNWTRVGANLLGTVFLYTDYTIPVEEVRRQLHEVLESTKLWDGKVWGLQVTNASEQTLELRALMSASDSSTAWDLRCFVREKLITFLQERYPQSLPRTRVEMNSLNVNSLSGAPRPAPVA
jgi:small-conductance mechanosensitive channel